jgi:hypothetical protein
MRAHQGAHFAAAGKKIEGRGTAHTAGAISGKHGSDIPDHLLVFIHISRTARERTKFQIKNPSVKTHPIG